MFHSAIAVPSKAPLWRQTPLGNWALCWLVLPNLPFAAMWLVGGMTRILDIFLIGIVGLLLRRSPPIVRFTIFVLLLTGSTVLYISLLFKLSLQSIWSSIGFVAELRPAASPEYLLGGLLLVGVVALAWPMMHRRQDFDLPPHLLAAGMMLIGLCWADWSLSDSSTPRAKPAAFSSAAAQSNFEGLASDGNHLVIVMVEALGEPRDPALRARLVERWRQPDIARRYDVETGSAPFWGSTTYGEMRELCGRWEDYHTLKSGADSRCLPARLAERGYQTTAYHGFDHGLFERTDWYPRIGFQHSVFRDGLMHSGTEGCDGVFPGACDRDVPARIGERLKRSDGKQFVYWLTLSSHLPVPESKALGTDRCERFDPALAREHAMICRLFVLWRQIDNSLAKMLTDPNLPATDVLIVGDHAPPFIDRTQRRQFEADRVPWILLKAKRGRVQPGRSR